MWIFVLQGGGGGAGRFWTWNPSTSSSTSTTTLVWAANEDFHPKIDSSSQSELFEIAHEIEVLSPTHFPKPTYKYNNSAVVPIVEPTFGIHRPDQDVVMVREFFFVWSFFCGMYVVLFWGGASRRRVGVESDGETFVCTSYKSTEPFVLSLRSIQLTRFHFCLRIHGVVVVLSLGICRRV